MTDLLRGFDVSYHQDPGKFDWVSLAMGGDFLICRATYGTHRDRAVDEFASCCRRHGVKLGLYHFYRPSEPAIEQAQAFAEVARSVGYTVGDIAPFVDIEDDPWPEMRTVDTTWAPGIIHMARQLESDWGVVGEYSNVADMVDLGQDGKAYWKMVGNHWVAHWTDAKQPKTLFPDWSIWQHAVEVSPFYDGSAIDHDVARRLPMVTRAPGAPADPQTVVQEPTVHCPPEWLDRSRRARQRQVNAGEWVERDET